MLSLCLSPPLVADFCTGRSLKSSNLHASLSLSVFIFFNLLAVSCNRSDKDKEVRLHILQCVVWHNCNLSHLFSLHIHMNQLHFLRREKHLERCRIPDVWYLAANF